MEARNLRKQRQGVVTSDKMDKTIVVSAKFKEKHPIYPTTMAVEMVIMLVCTMAHKAIRQHGLLQ